MEIKDLKTKCQKQIDLWGDNILAADVLLIQPGHWGKKDYRKLFGVKGEIVQEFETTIAVMYPAKKLLDAIEKLEVEDGQD